MRYLIFLCLIAATPPSRHLFKSYNCVDDWATQTNESLEAKRIADLFWELNSDLTEEDRLWLAAITKAESDWMPGRTSPAGAVGLMQLTSLAVIDAAEYCRLPVVTLAHLLKSERDNLRYGRCFVQSLQERKLSWPELLMWYNGGKRALTRFKRYGTLPKETALYVTRVWYWVARCTTDG